MSTVQNVSFFSPPSKNFKAELGDIILYINKWQLCGQRIISEQSSVNGVNLVTNSSERFKHLFLEGIWVNDEEPKSLIVKLDELIHNDTTFTVNLHHIKFTECRLIKYTALDGNFEPYINLKLELLAVSPPEEVSTDG
jgi:hypothetical protein